MDWSVSGEVNNRFCYRHLLWRKAFAPFMVRQKRNRSPFRTPSAAIIKCVKGGYPDAHCLCEIDTASKHNCVWSSEPPPWRIAFAVRQISQAASDLHHIRRGVYDDNRALEIVYEIVERTDPLFCKRAWEHFREDE